MPEPQPRQEHSIGLEVADALRLAGLWPFNSATKWAAYRPRIAVVVEQIIEQSQELLVEKRAFDSQKEFDIATKVNQAINEVAEATPDVPEGLDRDSHQVGYSTAVLALVSKLKFAKGK